jgi:cobalt-zinc-cadmium efflux system membrane fusion protein
MTHKLLNTLYGGACIVMALAVVACSPEPQENGETPVAEAEAAAADYPRGPNNGRLLSDENFALELAIFETGVPPEFHAWATNDGDPVQPGDVDLIVTLTRLGDVRNVIDFAPEGEFLRGTTVVYEPHSFSVLVEATHQGTRHRWTYESFEGRTTITPQLSQALGIETAIAGPAVLKQEVKALGRIVPNGDFTRSIFARFDGAVRQVSVSLGDRVQAGAPLIVVESDESLKPYTIVAPIAGIVTQRSINPGEQTDGRLLMEIMDATHVWAELAIYPADRSGVQVGAPVSVTPVSGGEPVSGTIAGFAAAVGAGQSIAARVPLDNSDGQLAPGTFVSASISSGEISMPLAVKRDGLQPFRDFTVVYAKVGNEYEVRMLELGRQDAEMIEVLGGLEVGTEYVTTNSYILKADVEKSAASHDH